MWQIFLKEIQESIYNPRIVMTFWAGTLLIMLAIFNGYMAYTTELETVERANILALDEARSQKSIDELGQNGLRVFRQPDKLTIFNIGVTGSVGNSAVIEQAAFPVPQGTKYAANPVLALFGELDFSFVVGSILSLFAILYSYNLISGERESGTLRMIMSNTVKRAHVITGKILGVYASLIISFLIPFMLGLTGLLLLTNISFSAEEWARIALLLVTSILYLGVFIGLGSAVSSLTKNSSVSFLIALFCWVISAVMIPRLSVNVAETLSPSASQAEIQTKLRNFRKEAIANMSGKYYKEYFEKNPTKNTELFGKMSELTNYAINRMNEDSQTFQDSLYRDVANQREHTIQLTRLMALASPTASYLFATNAFTNTGPESLALLENDLLQYRTEFSEFIKANKDEKNNLVSRMMARQMQAFKTDNSGYITYDPPKEEAPVSLDLSEMPRYQQQDEQLTRSVYHALLPVASMLFMGIVLFAIAIIGFLRYDVR